MNVKKFFVILFIASLAIFLGGFVVSHYETLLPFKPFYYVFTFAVTIVILVFGFRGLYNAFDEE
ncbi:hypothetical protein [Nosocomiicoccus massiliensis]|uniref:Uncharacterized protein n=1 Tax=Nosocomiicoccus massiliensis TaxID=1232430 RepID=A0AAF0YK01_9STAP|nr:hypothetical protein [Nosocomiicoccus massiliensis]WOS96858.1 hypothetical protein CJ229_003875 [Nosocomiicoccus massiliensis]